MKISTSVIPELVFYKNFSECTIKEALLYAFQHAENNTITLSQIGSIKVNGNRLLWSYGKAIQNLRREGYKIDTLVYHDPHKKITRSSYHIENPLYNPER
jgi:hypothetical protein